MGKNIRLGLVGAGHWGKRLIKTISALEGVSLDVVASKNPNTTNLVPEARVVSNWKELLKASLDGVCIAVPPTYHAQMLQAFLNVGIPVMVEKPLCLSLREADKLCDLVGNSPAPILVDHTQLFQPAYQVLKKCVKRFGSPRFIRSEGMALGPFRPDVSVLWDWSCHDIALCLDLMGRLPERVSAVGGDYAVEMMLTFGGGVVAAISNSNLSLTKRRLFEVYCGHRALVFNDCLKTKLLEYKIDFNSRVVHVPRNPSGTAIAIAKEAPLARVLKHFAEGIRRRDFARFNFGLACNVVRVLDAAERSIKKGVALSVTKPR